MYTKSVVSLTSTQKKRSYIHVVFARARARARVCLCVVGEGAYVLRFSESNGT